MFYSKALISLVFIAMAAHANYVNNYDEVVDFRCPSDQYISYISSVHDNNAEDRRWEYLCRTAPGPVINCVDSGYINNFDQPLLYMCPSNKVMTGMNSYHDNGFEDRRFGFRCCDVEGRVPSNCYLTDYVNNFDDKMTLAVPEGQVIKLSFSYHHDGVEDRRWRFMLCFI